MKRTFLYCLTGITMLLQYACTKPGIPVPPIETDTPAQLKLAVADSSRTFYLTPAASTEAARLAFTSSRNDMQATGIYVEPNATLVINATLVTGATRPRIAIGTPFRDNIRPVRQYFNLVEGQNVLQTDQYGGYVYVIYTAKDFTTQASTHLEFVSGFKATPYFRKGITTHDDWLYTLDSIGATVPDVLFESDMAYLIAGMPYAQEFKSEDQSLMVAQLDSIIAVESYMAGLEPGGGLHGLRQNKHLVTVRDSASGGYMAAGISIFYTEALSYRILQTAHLSGIKGWGLWHEIGHTFQQKAWTWDGLGETTGNVYAMAVERAAGIGQSRVTINNSWPKLDVYLAKPIGDRDFNAQGNELKLVFFHQLWLAFGDQLFISLGRQTRELTTVPATKEDKMRFFMVQACINAQKDLTDFYQQWGLIVPQSVYDEIAALGLPAPATDLTTLRDPV